MVRNWRRWSVQTISFWRSQWETVLFRRQCQNPFSVLFKYVQLVIFILGLLVFTFYLWHNQVYKLFHRFFNAQNPLRERKKNQKKKACLVHIFGGIILFFPVLFAVGLFFYPIGFHYLSLSNFFFFQFYVSSLDLICASRVLFVIEWKKELKKFLI